MKNLRFLALAGASALVAVASPASATTIIGGGTDVRLTSASTFSNLGINVATSGTASPVTNDANGVPFSTFLITGGSRNDTTGALQVIHSGSFLNFTASNNRSLSIGNFVIDTATNQVTGSASANGASLGTVSLFNLSNVSMTNATLSLTTQSANAFNTVFGGTNFAAGATVGTADINAVFTGTTAAVPEPAAWGMMIFGFGMVGSVMRRRATVRTAIAA